MADTKPTKNERCPCGSGRKLKNCCLATEPGGRLTSSRNWHGAGFTPFHTAFAPSPLLSIASPPVTPSRTHLPPDLKGKVFIPERMEWMDALLKEVKPGQEFIADSVLYKIRSKHVIEACPEIDVTKLRDADRPFDPDNWRAPESFDVVYVLDADSPNTGHTLMCDVKPHQHFAFQGRICYFAPSEVPGIFNVLDTGQVIRDRTDRLYVWVEYTVEDSLGKADISYRYPKGRLIPLTDGAVLPVEELAPGMQFLLELGGAATVTKVSNPVPWNPNAEFRDEYGNAFRRVIGKFRYEGWLQLMTVTVGGETHRVTPGHPYWSETRRGWYPIESFVVGELVQTRHRMPVPIQDLTPPQWAHETVYNLEVDEYHTYFVGQGTTSVWAHNGLGPVGCGVPQAARAESGKKANATRVGLAEDPKFAAGFQAIFGKKSAAGDTSLNRQQKTVIAQKWIAAKNAGAADPPEYTNASYAQKMKIRDIAHELIEANPSLLKPGAKLHGNFATETPGVLYNLVRRTDDPARQAAGFRDWQMGSVKKIGETTLARRLPDGSWVQERYTQANLDTENVAFQVVESGTQVLMRDKQTQAFRAYQAQFGNRPELNANDR